MAAGLWATNGGTLAYASSAFAGMHPQARGVALAMVNALGNLAQIYGSVGYLTIFVAYLFGGARLTWICNSICFRKMIVLSISWGSQLFLRCWQWAWLCFCSCIFGFGAVCGRVSFSDVTIL